MSVLRLLLDLAVNRIFAVFVILQSLVRPLKPGKCLSWNILFRRKHTTMRAQETHFLTQFSNELDVTDILEPFNVAAEFTDRKAVILYCPGRIYDVEKYPFFYNAIFKEAQVKRTLELCAFNTLLDGQKWPDIKVLFIWNVGRCGSTFLAQLFTCVPGTCVISEPDDFLHVPESLDPATRGKVMRNAFKYHMIQCVKRYPQTKLLVIKPRSFDFWYIFNIPIEVAQRVTHVFMYRDVLPTVKSFVSALSSYEVFNEGSPIYKLLKFGDDPPIVKAAMRFPELIGECRKLEEIRKTSNRVVVNFAFGGLPVLHLLYRKIVEIDDIPITGMKYEYLLDNPLAMMEKLYVKISPDLTVDESKLQVVCKGDSQRNSVLNRERMNKFRSQELSRDLRDALEKMMRVTGQEADLLPGFELPNTLKV